MISVRWTIGALLIAMAGCTDRNTPPSASIPHAIPPQAINGATIGLVRIRLNDGVADASVESLDGWLKEYRMDSLSASPLLAALKQAGALTVMIAVPGDAAVADDLGLYVGGTTALTQAGVEDCLIESMGLVGGAFAVVPMGRDWFFVGLTGDGVVEGTSPDGSAEFASLLAAVDDASFTVVISPSRVARALGLAGDGSGVGDYLADLLPSDDRRIARRARAFLQAADGAKGITLTKPAQGSSTIALVFDAEESGKAFADACENIRGDMRLALQGRIKRGEIDPQAAATELQFIDSLKLVLDGRSVRLVP